MTLFVPNHYDSLCDLFNHSFFEARSTETINGIEVFGYYDNVPYSCSYGWDDDDEVEWVSAGEPIL
jgi:hypothetical protein